MTAPVTTPSRRAGVDPLRAALVAKAGKGGGDEAMQAARLLENLFVRQLVKVLGKDVEKNSALFGKSVGRSIYQEMFKGAVADTIHDAGGLGLAAQLADQLRVAGGAKAAQDLLGRVTALGVAPSAPGEVATRLTQRRGIRALRAAKAASSAARSAEPASGRELGGVRFAAPNRRQARPVRDRDGKLRSPLASGRVGRGGRLSAQVGAPVAAAGSGKVVQVLDDGLLIDHGAGRQTLYRGLGTVEAQVGDLVLRGQALGEVGAKGELRFFVNQGGRWLQPPEVKNLLQAKGARSAPGSVPKVWGSS